MGQTVVHFMYPESIGPLERREGKRQWGISVIKMYHYTLICVS